MPELPEVETTRRALEPHLLGRCITSVIQRRTHLRWPIAPEFTAIWSGQRIEAVRRRAKYLLLDAQAGSALIHLGMSGSLRVLDATTPAAVHDHWDWQLDSGPLLRFTDPRRFGCLLYQPAGTQHPLLAGLGPEPLSADFDGDFLWRASRGRGAAIKTFLMNQAIVVGVGNIYAAESLFAAGIDPRRAAGRISRLRYQRLAAEVRRILAHAIERGGTTLRDFLSPDGTPGYFEQELLAYDREGLPCTRCGSPMKGLRLGQRQTVYCARCQT